MARWTALLRGINVGGKNIIKMETLRHLIEETGCSDVRTYIQSGNVAFSTSERSKKRLAERITAAIAEHHGFDISLLLRTQSELQKLVDGNPYPEASDQSVVVYVLERPSTTPQDELEQVCSETEAVELTKAAFYLHAPDGIARSKIAREAEKRLAVACTARNVRTLKKLLELC